MIVYDLSKELDDLKGILELQNKNLPSALTKSEMDTEGFVTLKHDIELLQKICGNHGHIIAKHKNKMIGYALVMENEFAGTIPILIPMFKKIEEYILSQKSNALRTYIVMGQICIDKPYRKQGVFRGLYNKMKMELNSHFAQVVTEVDESNVRSLHAHLGIGFEMMTRYESDGRTWVLIRQLWS